MVCFCVLTSKKHLILCCCCCCFVVFSLSLSFPKVLKAFGFGENICRWIATFYRKIISTVIVNGQTSSWFSTGDPVSPYLFVLCVEISATMIRENVDIKGICINEVEQKTKQKSQFADDAQLMNIGDIMSFEKALDTIEKYGKVSGLFLNTD